MVLSISKSHFFYNIIFGSVSEILLKTFVNIFLGYFQSAADIILLYKNNKQILQLKTVLWNKLINKIFWPFLNIIDISFKLSIRRKLYYKRMWNKYLLKTIRVKIKLYHLHNFIKFKKYMCLMPWSNETTNISSNYFIKFP